nr:immunoglobulin light chain junction region [Macaca mulatta]
YMQALEYPLTF